MRITVGHTPDADDAFMFYGMLEGKIPPAGFAIRHTVEDIEGLNKKALDPELDVSAVSVHACAHIKGHTILRSGGSFGLGYGPIVTARKDISEEQLRHTTITVPGTMTSAFLLLQLMIGRFEYKVMRFDEIPEAVRDGRADAGLIIHESQITYEQDGNTKVADVGKWWDEKTGLPVPLGINVIRSMLGADTISRFDRHLQESIRFGRDNRDDAIEYSMRYCRGRPKHTIDRFVGMYVNESTVNMGERGERAIREMLGTAHRRGLVPAHELDFAPPL